MPGRHLAASGARPMGTPLCLALAFLVHATVRASRHNGFSLAELSMPTGPTRSRDTLRFHHALSTAFARMGVSSSQQEKAARMGDTKCCCIYDKNISENRQFPTCQIMSKAITAGIRGGYTSLVVDDASGEGQCPGDKHDRNDLNVLPAGEEEEVLCGWPAVDCAEMEHAFKTHMKDANGHLKEFLKSTTTWQGSLVQSIRDMLVNVLSLKVLAYRMRVRGGKCPIGKRDQVVAFTDLIPCGTREHLDKLVDDDMTRLPADHQWLIVKATEEILEYRNKGWHPVPSRVAARSLEMIPSVRELQARHHASTPELGLSRSRNSPTVPPPVWRSSVDLESVPEDDDDDGMEAAEAAPVPTGTWVSGWGGHSDIRFLKGPTFGFVPRK